MLTRFVLFCCLAACQMAYGGSFVGTLQERPKAVLVDEDVKLDATGLPLDAALVANFCASGAGVEVCNLDAELSQDFAFVKLTPGSLTFKRLYYKADEPQLIHRQMAFFRDTPLEDEMGKRYVSFAAARGNTVKMYRPVLTDRLMRLFDPNFTFRPARNITNYTNVENALIEHAPDGRMVSVMMRGHQLIYNFSARSYQYTTYVYGEEFMRLLENRVSNRFLAETYIRSVSARGDAE